MKNNRQSLILEIISQENIETQEQLLTRLQERGVSKLLALRASEVEQKLGLKLEADMKE